MTNPRAHDAVSLGFYLGKPVEYTDRAGNQIGGNLIAIDLGFMNGRPVAGIKEGEEVFWPIPEVVYPILKTYHDLLTLMEYEGVVKPAIEHVYEVKIVNYEPSIESWGVKLMHEPTCSVSMVNKDFSHNLITGNNFKSSIEILTKLHALGFGAIECSESPTGHVDWNGRYCVRAEG